LAAESALHGHHAIHPFRPLPAPARNPYPSCGTWSSRWRWWTTLKKTAPVGSSVLHLAHTALHTKVRLGRILLTAPGTSHAAALQSLSRRTSKGCPERSCAAGAGQGHPRVSRKRPAALVVDEAHHHVVRRWSSARTKYAAAFLQDLVGAPQLDVLALELLRALSLLGRQAERWPLSRSVCRIQLRSVSAGHPIFSATDVIAAHCDACSFSCSRTIHTARPAPPGNTCSVWSDPISGIPARFTTWSEGPL
jgi:hypothetical protein